MISRYLHYPITHKGESWKGAPWKRRLLHSLERDEVLQADGQVITKVVSRPIDEHWITLARHHGRCEHPGGRSTASVPQWRLWA